MEESALFKLMAVLLLIVFVYYGMDVRRKTGARDFVAAVWQVLMKLCSFILLAAFAWALASAHEVSAGDWLSLVFFAIGTAFIAGAKRALGTVHTFAGQYQRNPKLVTHGVYAMTRNPLYFGVFLCEFGALLFMLHQTPALLPQSYPYWLSTLALALIYAVVFNGNMAIREARYLEACFGTVYHQYQARVPFLVPSFSLRKEVE